MMGKKKFYTGVIVGALLGGFITLFDEDAKQYVKKSIKKSGETLRSYTKNPTEAIERAKRCASTVQKTVDDNVSGALHTLETIESSLNKFINK